MKYPAEQHSTFFLNFQSEKWIEGIILVSLKPKNITKTVYAQIICAEGDRETCGMLAEVSELLLQQRTTSDGPWWKRLDRDTGMAGMEAPGSRSCFSSFQVNANPNNSVKVQTYNIRGKTPPITQSSTSKHQSQQEGKPPHGLSSVPIRPLLNMFGTYFIRGSQTNDHCITVSCIYSGMESSSG